MKNSLRHIAVVFSFASALVAIYAHAIVGQPGTLDTTWNGTGKVITAIGAGFDGANALTLQSDGKIVVAGGCFRGDNYDFCLARYQANGALDTSFNNTGTAITAISQGYDYPSAVALQSDGRIVVAGSCSNGSNTSFCLARYQTNGALDASFNTVGTVITPIGSSGDHASAVAVQPDGKIVVAGYCNTGRNQDFCLARYQANGTLDTSFNTTGKVITTVGESFDTANALALQPDGKIVVAGSCDDVRKLSFCLVRYNPNGTLDTSFNNSGKVITAIGASHDSAFGLALQPDGKIVVAGFCYNGSNYDFCLARYQADGAFDICFNATGKVITPIGSGNDQAYALALQPDGKILLAGFCHNGSNYDFCLARYRADGVLDTSLSTTGKAITPIGSGNDQAYALALQTDGKIVVAGLCYNGDDSDFCLARYEGGSFACRDCEPSTTRTLTEYIYNPLNYYFLTSRDSDKAILDVAPGWACTGQSFVALSDAEPGTRGISRYYFDQVAKNQTRGSHFYTLVDSEKIALGALNPSNQRSPRLPYYEGIDSYAFPPVVEGVGGRCAAGQTPVYRTFRGQSRFPDDPNHRFTTSITLYNQLVAQGWDGEGVKMCAPN